MKKLFPILMGLSLQATAQTGEVHYTRTTTFGDMEVEGMPAELAALLPKENKSNYILYFTPAASMYENAPQEEKEVKEVSGDNFRIRIDTDEDQTSYYTDRAAKSTVQQQELAGRLFLIEGEQERFKWKMTGNQKKILGYAAMEATCITDKDTIEAWYTPDIAVALGPEDLGGLPGLILEATVNKKSTITASAIHLDKDVAGKIKAPKKGKKVTAEEYAKIAEEKLKERIEETNSNGGNQIIIKRY